VQRAVQDTHPDHIIHLQADHLLHLPIAADLAPEVIPPDLQDRQAHLPVPLQDLLPTVHQEEEGKCNKITACVICSFFYWNVGMLLRKNDNYEEI